MSVFKHKMSEAFHALLQEMATEPIKIKKADQLGKKRQTNKKHAVHQR